LQISFEHVHVIVFWLFGYVEISGLANSLQRINRIFDIVEISGLASLLQNSSRHKVNI
jgi:hypothetical protein